MEAAPGGPTDLGAGGAVAVIAAMVQEIRPIVRTLGLEPVELGELRAREGATAGRSVVATVTSMGTSAATGVTSELLDRRAIDHVIVVGICGGIDPDLAVGALIVPTEAVVEETGRICRPRAVGPQQPAGRLLTTDQLHTDPGTVSMLHEEGYVAVDMETAAIGAVCEDRGVAWSVFRAVSDRAGDPAVDTELMAMSVADGSPRPRAVARYVLRHPGRIPKLAGLGRGMRRAVDTSTSAALAALQG